jgi:CHAP domain/Putative peptidoglycan binding domain
MTHIATHFDEIEAVPFPGRIVKAGDSDKETVKKIQHRLNSVGCGPVTEDGIFDKDRTEKSVKLFQVRFPDVNGRPLVVDGKVGQLTWGAMFGASTVPSSLNAPTELTKAVIDFANTQLHVRENPLGSNRGFEVDAYLSAVGLPPPPGNAWCVAFTYYCYAQGAKKIGIPNPHIKTAGVLAHWNEAGLKPKVERITTTKALSRPELIKPGCLFIIDSGGGFGHSGIVISVKDGRLETIEGNTNGGGSRDGIGVFRRDSRKITSINKGFIDYSRF